MSERKRRTHTSYLSSAAVSADRLLNSRRRVEAVKPPIPPAQSHLSWTRHFRLLIDTGQGLSSQLFLSKKVTLEVNVNRVRGFYFFCFFIFYFLLDF